MIGRALLTNPWVLLGGGLLLLGVLSWSHVTAYRMGGAQGREDVAEVEKARADERVKSMAALLEVEKAQAERYRIRADSNHATAEQYREALNDANRKHDRTVADLRAGNLRLREQWRGCPAVPAPGQAASGGPGTDAGTDDRAASAGRIVRAAAACDAQVKGLQAIIRSDRRE